MGKKPRRKFNISFSDPNGMPKILKKMQKNTFEETSKLEEHAPRLNGKVDMLSNPTQAFHQKVPTP